MERSLETESSASSQTPPILFFLALPRSNDFLLALRRVRQWSQASLFNDRSPRGACRYFRVCPARSHVMLALLLRLVTDLRLSAVCSATGLTPSFSRAVGPRAAQVHPATTACRTRRHHRLGLDSNLRDAGVPSRLRRLAAPHRIEGAGNRRTLRAGRGGRVHPHDFLGLDRDSGCYPSDQSSKQKYRGWLVLPSMGRTAVRQASRRRWRSLKVRRDVRRRSIPSMRASSAFGS